MKNLPSIRLFSAALLLASMGLSQPVPSVKQYFESLGQGGPVATPPDLEKMIDSATPDDLRAALPLVFSSLSSSNQEIVMQGGMALIGAGLQQDSAELLRPSLPKIHALFDTRWAGLAITVLSELRPAPQPAGGAYSSFYGGSATLNWTYNGTSGQSFNFSILGQNPSQSTVQAALGGWPAVNISIHESGLQEFVTSSNGPGGNTPGFPMKDDANGFGLMALTAPPTPTEDQKWNWQSNVNAGLGLLQTKMQLAYNFLQNQIGQWNTWNSAHPNQLVAAAPDYWATSCCIFSTQGTGTMTYDQADGLKRYAGLGTVGASFLVLTNPVGASPPAWTITPGNGVAADIVYQFATCSSVGSSCQHSGTGCIRGSLGCPIQ